MRNEAGFLHCLPLLPSRPEDRQIKPLVEAPSFFKKRPSTPDYADTMQKPC